MFDISLKEFVFSFTFLICFLIVSTVLYVWYVYMPYMELPSCRLEHRIPYWFLKRVPLNYAVFQTLIKQAKRYESEGVFALWLGVPSVVVYGEEIVKKIVNEPAATDKPKNYKLLEFAIGKGIFSSNGEEWKRQWKMAAPAFHATALKSYIPTMNRHSEEMVQSLSELNGQPTDDILNILSLCALGILDETNLGEKDKNPEKYSHTMKLLNKTTDFMIKRYWSPWMYFDFTLQLFPSAREARKVVKEILKEFLQPRLENIKESLVSRQALSQAPEGKRLKPMGESFVEQHLQDATITMDEVTRQVSFIVGAAFDTVTHSLKFAFFLLGLNQDVQERAFEEVMSGTEGHFTYDDLQRLTYLECVIKETLRLYTVPVFGRQISKDLEFGEFKLPKNSIVGVLTYMLHRNPEIYPDPEKFNPERFLDKNSRIKPWNFIPFAEGIRSCIGKNYAMVKMKIILAHVLRNFRIISLDRALKEEELNWSIVLQCTKKLRMQFVPRESLQT